MSIPAPLRDNAVGQLEHRINELKIGTRDAQRGVDEATGQKAIKFLRKYKYGPFSLTISEVRVIDEGVMWKVHAQWFYIDFFAGHLLYYESQEQVPL